METTREIRNIADNLRGTLARHPIAQPNRHAVAVIKFNANQLRGLNHYAAEKASQLASLAEDFYSAHRHKHHPGGAARLYRRMQRLLDSIEQCAEPSSND